MKLTQMQFLKLVGSFNIIASMTNYVKKDVETGEQVERNEKLIEARAKELQRFSTLWSELTEEQKSAIDNLIESELDGFSHATFTELANLHVGRF